MRIEWVTTRLASGARRAVASLPATALLPYLRHGWFDAWLRAFADAGRVATPVGWEGDRMVACLPAVRAGLDCARWPTGRRRSSPGGDRAGTRRAACCVRRSSAPRALVLDATRLAARRASGRGMARAAAVRDARAPLADVSGHRDDRQPRRYTEPTRPQWMKRLARYRRKMDREMGLELSVADLPADAGSAFEECLRLEAAGWKGDSGTAILSSPATEGFYRAVFEMLLDSGELRLSLLRLDGALAAFDIGFGSTTGSTASRRASTRRSRRSSRDSCCGCRSWSTASSTASRRTSCSAATCPGSATSPPRSRPIELPLLPLNAVGRAPPADAACGRRSGGRAARLRRHALAPPAAGGVFAPRPPGRATRRRGSGAPPARPTRQDGQPIEQRSHEPHPDHDSPADGARSR